MTGLDQIPTTAAPAADARPSEIVARIRSLRPSRRAVLRGLVIGAAAAALVPLDWFLTRRSAVAAPDDRSEHLTCSPESYTEESNNWWEGGAAVCYGGWRRGSYPCSGGYHVEGEHGDRGETFVSTRLTSSCHGRNAWRWNGYRCSDAMTRATFDDGTEYAATTIAACLIDPAAAAEAPPAAEPAPAPQRDPEPAPETTRRRAPQRDEVEDGQTQERRRPLLPGLGSDTGVLSGLGR